MKQLTEQVVQWADIPETQGLYKVSNLGEVKSIPRSVNTYNGGYYITKERILKPFLCGRKGNQYLALDINSKIYRVHRLVAQVFVPGISEDLIVNHKDGDRLNNNSNNLEWVSYAENKLHSIKKLYKCIYLCNNTKKYRVRINHENKVHNLGRFNTAIEAATVVENFVKSNNIKTKYIL